MASKAEIFGAALGKAIRKTAANVKAAAEEAKATAAKSGPPVYRTSIRSVPRVEGLRREDGWVDAQVQLLIDRQSAGADHVIGRILLKPGARHERHRHRDCDAFFIVIKGRGHVYSELGEEPAAEGDVVYSPRDCWHGFANTSDEEVVLLWGLLGAGSIAASGYEVDPTRRTG